MKRKNLLVLAVACAFTVALLAGCSNKSNEETDSPAPETTNLVTDTHAGNHSAARRNRRRG